MIKIKKERLDKLLVDKKLIDSREKARRVIMANLVTVNGEKVNKVGSRCSLDSKIVIEKLDEGYVSRGGNKLEKALHEFNIEVVDSIVMDVGASTGGFTDCLLKHGAQKVYCIDVGYGQLAWNLRNDSRIINLEKTNIRYLDKEKIEVQFDLVTIDVSFISLKIVLPVIKEFLKPSGKVVALVKPQFEAGKEKVKKGGIVSEPDVHQQVMAQLISTISNDFQLMNMTFSPIKNSPGNIEYLIYLKKGKGKISSWYRDRITKTVLEAHQYFFGQD